ncbi:winged helix-turn-helix domain-containing protein [Escherichia fergusonii]|uniref:winged helix-turn-helix domain-containing protein n=1 Tax=Escherichia fergusonii TaxID=564 RepID=UPI0015E55432|nr:winged helix-turn-helix domain-containing protein [Escherichia fergusonii]EHG6155476.1 winged helix family transcriptional regulator [Escherichia fergusonii]EHG6214270.1 winged helix family transcriptional regulator [Escherichia fergusonii]QLM90037.1 winged helix-turn-helix domain-containing protein [Escherichia fergusonii]QLN36944.1 winged helix-turn-helix domain-containing protein [Escherichia fergusonii]QMH67438.1 winged helix-turn-helix domain-containing protein [Escherichia fergusonii]
MRYNINARFIYDATDGTLTLPQSTEPDCQLSVTSSALLNFFLHHTDIVSREEVLKKVWDDNGLTSSNSNLNQYLSMLRKTFRHYGIDNIIITVARGYLQLNPDVSIEPLDEAPAPPAIIEPFLIPDVNAPTSSEDTESAPSTLTPVTHSHDAYWYFAGACLLTISILLVAFNLFGISEARPIALTQLSHSQCELLASDEMRRSVSVKAYEKNYDEVRKRLNIACKPGERFLFFYGDRLETNGLGRVFLAHCAMHEDNPFSYCDNYFYYSWKP